MSEDPHAELSEVNRKVKIDSGNIVSFLCHEIVPPKIESFASTIVSPPELTNMIQAMYEETKTTTDKGDFYRQTEEEFRRKVDSVLPGFSEREAISEQETTMLAEQARMLALDVGTNQLDAVGPIYGKGHEVDLMPLIEESLMSDMLPILPAHTHPKDIIFSIPDHFPILLRLTTGRRLTNGFLVVCPDFQMLVLATAETPHFDDPLKLSRFIFDRIAEHNKTGDEMAISLAAELKQLAEYKVNLEAFEEIRRLLTEKLGEEGGRILDAAATEAAVTFADPNDVDRFVVHKTNDYQSELNRYNNSEQFAFGKEMATKQYISYDGGKTFKEFSA